MSLVSDRESVWVFPILFEQDEEAAFADAQHLLNLGSRQQSLAVSLEQHLDSISCESSVQLGHFVPPNHQIDWEEP